MKIPVEFCIYKNDGIWHFTRSAMLESLELKGLAGLFRKCADIRKQATSVLPCMAMAGGLFHVSVGFNMHWRIY